MSKSTTPLVLVILDGFGHREETKYNAILAANTPNFNNLLATMPHGLISGSGLDVGLPDGQMGNSEVGHMNLGAGRVVYQDLTRITKAIETGEFFKNTVLCHVIDQAITKHKAIHIMGLLSAGGVHSHEDHILKMVEMAAKQGAEHVYVHAFLDGRDTPPKSAESSIIKLNDCLAKLGKGRIATMIGRYYAMDRDNRWERVQAAYDLIVDHKADYITEDAVSALQAAYERGESDEFVKATRIGDIAPVEDGDAVIFMNFRADRARQLTRAFVEKDFNGFVRSRVPDLAGFVMLTQYAATIETSCAFPPSSLKNGLGEYLAKQGKKQLRIAETEKYAHVTFFFSGGREEPYDGEDRILIPSPKVPTYDVKPEMSAHEVTDKIVEAIEQKRYDVIVVNYANGDMVGHTGVFSAAVKAVETLDHCLGRIINALKDVGGEALITADHGNVEKMQDDETGQAHTAHTCELVPFIYVGERKLHIRQNGVLADVAPTMLNLLGMTIPEEMSGKSLVVFE